MILLTLMFYMFFSSSAVENSTLSCGKSCQLKQNHMNNVEEKNKMDSHVYFVKLDTDIDTDNHRDAIEILTQPTDKKEMKNKEDRRDTQENSATIHRNNSVSKMTQHFKALQEKVSVTASDSQHISMQKSSRGVQRYRERKKTQACERFNTQPVTSQEVREAVLQNQRNIVASNISGTLANEPEPSKLSLAERVRLFDQKIATSNTAAYQERLTQNKRLSTRYKTQPVTSEEVEVASRISSLNVNHQIQALIGGKY